MKCDGQRLDGSRCRAFALKNGTKCSLHADKARAAVLARSKRKSRSFKACEMRKFAAPKTAADLRVILATTIVELRECSNGKIDVKVANAIATVAGIMLRALDASVYEQRLTRLETIASQLRTGRSRHGN